MKRTRGFTLIELLAVIAILGILLAVGVPSYRNWLISVELNIAARQVESSIKDTRMTSKRTAATTQMTTTGNSSSYTANGRTVTLDGALITTASSVAFNAPYGTTATALPVTISIQSTRDSTKTRTVRIVSRMGKVVIQ